MKDFLFPPEKARTPVGVLSGGERGRLILARELAKPSNLLILDEPTNDLDLETLDMLQEMLADYPGTILLVSHDRDFLDRVATSVLMAEGNGKWTEYAGGYSDMVAQRGAGVEARKTKAEPAKSASSTTHGLRAGPAQALLQGKARARNAPLHHEEARIRDRHTGIETRRRRPLHARPEGLRAGGITPHEPPAKTSRKPRSNGSNSK
jgi:ABC transport system ATP-binding/permease protein